MKEEDLLILTCMYILIGLILDKFVISYLPSILRAFFALPLILLIPIATGEIFFKMIVRKLRFNTFFEDMLAKTILYWFMGYTIIFLFATVISFLGFFSISMVVLFVLFLFVISLFHNFTKLSDGKTHFIMGHHMKLKELTINDLNYIILTCFSIIVAIFLRRNSPFPLIPGCDSIRASGYILEIRNGGFRIDLFNWPHYLTQYPPAFHLLMAIVTHLFSVEPIELFWVKIFLDFPIFSLLTYKFIKDVTNNEIQGFLGTVLAIFLNEKGSMPHIFFPSPAGMFQIMFVASLYIVFFILKEGIHKFKGETCFFIFIIDTGLFITHTSLSFVFIGNLICILAVKIIVDKYLTTKYKILLFYKTIFLALFLFVVITLCFGEYIKFPFYISLPNTPYVGHSISYKITLLISCYTKILVVLSIIGILAAIILGQVEVQPLIFFGLLLFVEFFLPIHMIIRILVMIRIFLSMFIAETMLLPIGLFHLIIDKNGRNKIYLHNKKLIYIYLLLVLISFFPAYSKPYLDLQNYFLSNDIPFSNIAQWEVDASMFLRHFSDINKQKLLIISDPYSQEFLVALIGRDKAEHLGGVWTPRSLKELIYKAILTNTSKEAYILINDVIKELPDKKLKDKILLVISGRTTRWIKTYPRDTDLYDKVCNITYVDKFLKGNNYFRLLYNSTNNIFVFEIILR